MKSTGRKLEHRPRYRPAAPASGEQLRPSLDLVLDDVSLDVFEAPPMRGKTHPRAAMNDAVPTLDDEHRAYHHHPAETAGVLFGFDPVAADAAADLAGELGCQFLEGATRAEDMSARVVEIEDEEEAEALPFGIDNELGTEDEVDEAVDSIRLSQLAEREDEEEDEEA